MRRFGCVPWLPRLPRCERAYALSSHLMLSLPAAVFLLNLAATWFMTGLIWFVQVVHYPLMGGALGDGFAAYHRQHVARTTRIVAPVMLLELATAALLPWLRPAEVPVAIAWVGLALVLVAWGSTVLLQIPRHNALAACYADATHGALCRTNWIRTIAWSARAVILLYAAGKVLRS